ncbi:DsbA family protein [Bacteriovorax sp. Seq25_V]|uniref:DsbA family protein n=1 Tax=Bacteriovorax sp. Seq25_V TaxID=1201288 RepID=UPI00038A4D40|nr:DsbA family protein [Bacteriovorax sp. Seq25_V]EQC45448.1 DSBA-like thioredoxin domain protein [Bacteriovorax sp. Seq25_V]
MDSKLYFDFTSPYSYLLWEKLIQTKFDFSKVIIKPVVVGKIINDVGSVGPAGIPSKRNFLFQDCIRKAHRSNIKFQAPARLPFNPMDLLRFACALENNQAKQIEFITNTFRFGWRDGGDYESFSKFKSWIMDTCHFTEEEYENLNSDRNARKQLKLNIQDAIESQVFGVPSLTNKGTVFWGLDAFEDFQASLKGEDPLNMHLSVYKKFIDIVQGEQNG